MLTALYGPKNLQLLQFRDDCQAIAMTASNTLAAAYANGSHAFGAIRAAKAEIEHGLAMRLRVAVAGEVLAEISE